MRIDSHVHFVGTGTDGSGDHGLDGYKGPMWDAWQAGVLKWLAGRGVVR